MAQRQDEILVEGGDVRHWVLLAMRDSGQSEIREEAADAFIDEVCRRSGLLLPRGEDQFAFTHLSFQEYFAAVFLLTQFVLPPRRLEVKGIQGAGREDLNAYDAHSVWQEALVFLAELTAAEQPDWSEELFYGLFGEGFADALPLTTDELDDDDSDTIRQERISRVNLLARLAIDPHAGLNEDGLKWTAIAHCCAFEAQEQARKGTEIREAIIEMSDRDASGTISVLLGAERVDQPRLLRIFVDAIRESGTNTLSLKNSPINDLLPSIVSPTLQTLDLKGTDVADLSPLSALHSLSSLRLWDTQVSDVSPLAALAKLQFLDLDGTRVSDIGPLAGLIRLESLELRRTPISDLVPLRALTGLRSLCLARTQVESIKPLAALSGLTFLDLSSTGVSNVEPLALLTGLETLVLTGTPVSDVAPLARLTNLRSLNLANTGAEDINPLGGLTGLQTLELQAARASDSTPLSPLTGLRRLYLEGTEVDEHALQELRQALPGCRIML